MFASGEPPAPHPPAAVHVHPADAPRAERPVVAAGVAAPADAAAWSAGDFPCGEVPENTAVPDGATHLLVRARKTVAPPAQGTRTPLLPCFATEYIWGLG